MARKPIPAMVGMVKMPKASTQMPVQGAVASHDVVPGHGRDPLDQHVPGRDQRPDRGQGQGVAAHVEVAPHGGDPEDHGQRVHGDALEPAQLAGVKW